MPEDDTGPPNKDTMSVSEVAARMGISDRTIYRMVRENRFPVRPLPLPFRHFKFSTRAIERFLNKES